MREGGGRGKRSTRLTRTSLTLIHVEIKKRSNISVPRPKSKDPSLTTELEREIEGRQGKEEEGEEEVDARLTDVHSSSGVGIESVFATPGGCDNRQRRESRYRKSAKEEREVGWLELTEGGEG